MEKERAQLLNYLKKKGRKGTSQRLAILKVFLETEKHITAEELFRLVRKKYPGIGYSTVYRTMKLFSEAGISRRMDAGDRTTRFEHGFGHEHHDHLICTRCKKFIEVRSDQIEELQETLAHAHDFKPRYHRMEIFGLCRDCLRAPRKRR